MGIALSASRIFRKEAFRMKKFMDQDFMLRNKTGARLYHSCAAHLPLVDYHCHLSPREIYENQRFDNIAQIWLGGRQEDGTYYGDHYKWRLMRSNGVPEEKITGGADPYVKFQEFAKTLEMAIGNPMYHWCNLELHKYFGITEALTPKNCREIYDKCNALLQNDPDMCVRGLIKKSNVAFIGTTDDPIDNLEWHEKLAAEPDLGFQVCPSFRPDKAINIHKPGFAQYMKKLAQTAGKTEFQNIQEVLDALTRRVAFFKDHGCRASDHGLDYVMYRPASLEEADAAFKKAIKGDPLTLMEQEIYQTAILLHLARTYHKHNIVMEIHYSCRRDNNERMFALEGPDTGFDMIAQNNCIAQLAQLMSRLEGENALPKMILFSLDSTDFDRIGTLMGCFQSEEIPGKIQMGAAWWFLDTKDGMEQQMRSLARLGLLGNFVGMLTDSRSFLSYTRHDYFRRILCNMIGDWVENGEYPAEEESMKKIIEGICCKNAQKYFNI